MKLTRENLEVFAATHYCNDTCSSKAEFLEDLESFSNCRKLANRINNESSVNIRLLCNYIICITNVFHLEAVKEIFKFTCTDELSTIKTAMNYLNFMRKDEWPDVSHSLIAAKLLKEMDR